MKLTADTITDHQIRELRSGEYLPAVEGCDVLQYRDGHIVELCDIALYDERTLSRAHSGDVAAMKHEARAQLAAIFNKRHEAHADTITGTTVTAVGIEK
jgi:hypothetical protein